MKDSDRFMCATCPSHEDQSNKVNIMWGAGKVIGVVGSLFIIGLFGLIMDTRHDAETHVKIKDEKIEAVDSSSIQRDQEIVTKFLNTTTDLANRDNNIAQVYTEISINLKRLMESQGVRYIESAHAYSPSGEHRP